MAVAARGGADQVEGVIFHTDRGSTCTAERFTALCRRVGIRQSMGRVGPCFDNAAAEAFFSSLEWEVLSRNDFFVGGGVTHRLPRLVGLRRATELLILGERFTGAQALEWDLANAAPAAADLDDAAGALAARLAAKAPLSLARMKTTLNRADGLDEALRTEAAALLALMTTQDWAEGVAAFAERRAPVFGGK